MTDYTSISQSAFAAARKLADQNSVNMPRGVASGDPSLKTIKTTLDENLAMIRDSITHLRQEGQRVFLDAEHFFDGYRANRAYALEVVRVAAEAGADVILEDLTQFASWLHSMEALVAGRKHHVSSE